MNAFDAKTAEVKDFDINSISQVKPFGDNILVFPVPLMQERMLASGIIIPETQLEFHDKPRWGTVIAVGDKVKDIVPAQQVLIREGSGVQMFFQDTWDREIREYLFVKKEHCVASFY